MTSLVSLIFLATSFSVFLLLARAILKRVIGVSTLTFGTQSAGMVVYSLLFLPGTIIHELAHFFVATVLLVPTGDITILPHLKEDEDRRVKLGHVMIAKTDVIRSSLIGLAPLIVGSALLLMMFHLHFSTVLLPLTPQSVIATVSHPISWLLFYLMTAISNTMFSSREDMRHWPVLGFILAIVFIVVAVIGSIQTVVYAVNPVIITVANSLTAVFIFTIMLNCSIFIALLLIEKIIQRIRKKRLVY